MIISQKSNGTQNGSEFGLSKGDEKRKCYELFTSQLKFSFDPCNNCELSWCI